MAQHEVYSSPTLRAFAVVAPDSDRRRIVVAFAPWFGTPALTTPGAAPALLQRIVNICAAAGLAEPVARYRERLERIAAKAAA